MARGGVTRKKAKEYPLHKEEYWESSNGVMSRRWKDAHECNRPGNYRPRKKDNTYESSNPWEVGSFWECPVCTRIWVFKHYGDRGDTKWQLMRQNWFALWKLYHRAKSAAPTTPQEDV